MSLTLAVQGIRTALEQARAAWNAVPGNYQLQIEYDNRLLVDLASLSSPYLMMDVVWHDAQQLDIGRHPMVADYGSIILSAGVKEGGGTMALITLLEFIRPYLQLRDDIGVRTQAASLQKQVYKDGICYQPMLIPFWVAAPATLVTA